MRTIMETLLDLLDRREDGILVTVAAAQGSTPRGAGSQLLAGRSGLLAGTVGGGPGAAQALLLAADCLRAQRSGGEPWPGRPWSGWRPAVAERSAWKPGQTRFCWRRAALSGTGCGWSCLFQ